MRFRTVAIVGFLCLAGYAWQGGPPDTADLIATSNDQSASSMTVQEEKKVSVKIAAVPIVIVGEGGTSGFLFQYAADTFIKENGGVKYTVHDGDEFMQSMRTFKNEHGAISEFVYFGHGNEVGLYVNQAPNINGALYANDPALNEPFRAGSIYDLPRETFASGSLATFYGCNVAKTNDEQDSFAEQFANHFNVTVIAATGPTEFSFSKDAKQFIKVPASVITQPLYMVPTADDKGFITVEPSPFIIGYDDVHESSAAADAITELSKRGLLFDASGSFRPYASITYDDAQKFCMIINPDDCDITGADPTEKMRNTAALKMLLDAAGYKLKKTGQPYQAQIHFATINNMLTPDFTHKRWYTRAEMAMLTAKILAFQESFR
jgi:hypothetical protein